ncbi:MAG: tetratricopeptide repeat protein [Gammaproteobacteria bacterium]|nr:tetratricopeptide repeat protein [Gammaproteobacteria bacterium]
MVFRKILSLLILASLAPQVHAANNLTERMHKHLGDVQLMIGDEKYDQAKSKLDTIFPSMEHDPYLRTLGHQTYAFIYASKEQYPKAERHFEDALKNNTIPESLAHSILYNLAQVYMAQEQYKKTIDTVKRCFTYETKPIGRTHALAGISYAQLKSPDNAIKHLEIAIRNDDQAQEAWYKLLLGLYFQKKDYQNAITILEEMVREFPKTREYWQQLSGLYFTVGNTTRSLTVYELARKMGYLEKETEYMNLAKMYAFNQDPFEAASVVQEGLEKEMVKPTEKNLKFLSEAWLQAKEHDKALEALLQAAKVTDNPDLYYSAAQVNLDMSKWSEAVKAATKATRSREPKMRAKAYLVKGIAQYENKQYSDAILTFRHLQDLKVPASAKDDVKSQKKQAGQWIAHIQDEMGMMDEEVAKAIKDKVAAVLDKDKTLAAENAIQKAKKEVKSDGKSAGSADKPEK